MIVVDHLAFRFQPVDEFPCRSAHLEASLTGTIFRWFGLFFQGA